MALQFFASAIRGELRESLEAIYEPIAEAGTAAMREMGDAIKLRGRANIAAAGFSRKWQNAFRVDVFPKRGASADAAAWVYHRIPYADVFETGETIRGKPTLWVPLPTAPKRIGRKKITPKRFVSEIGPLFPIRGRGGMPLLAANVAARRRLRPGGALSLSSLRRGAHGDGPTQAVPIFVGLPTVTLSDRFSLREITRNGASLLAELYARNLRVR